jgi:succinate dehydrogenase/fumarate reductase flavoprotein subunit
MDNFKAIIEVAYATSKANKQLEAEIKIRQIPIFNHCQMIDILKYQDRAVGLLGLCKEHLEQPSTCFMLFNCSNIIFATGGPAGIYADSVYPLGQNGSSGVALEAGVKGKNLTEWQYGLASISPRWNVSGTYMQVLPRFISIDAKGQAHAFLEDYFHEPSACLSMIFKKVVSWLMG